MSGHQYSPETQALLAAVAAGDVCPECGAANHLRHFDECPRHPDNQEANPCGPARPAEGHGPGRWVLLGEVGVDSASIAITDLLMGTNSPGLMNVGAADSRYAVPGSEFAGDWGTGVRFWAGFGDGGYQVWGWVVDYRDEGDPEPDERVAQVVVTMIDDRQLADWRRG